MKETLIVDIEKLIPGGRGLARLDGKVIFVPLVVAGERVKVRIIEEKKNYSEAELIEVIESSDERVKPPCPLYGRCGGCNMQHMSYKAQLEAKQSFAQNLLLRNSGIEIESIPIIESKPFSYRNRIQVHSSQGHSGFRRRSGSEIIEINHCPVVADGINLFFKQKPAMENDERITVFGTDDWYSSEREDKDISVKVLDKSIHFNSRLFFQSNLSLLPYLGDYLKKNVRGGGLLDLYCGVGLMSSMVEDQVDFIEAVELNRYVEPYIKKNISGNYKFYPLSLEKWIHRKKGSLRGVKTIIIDPPRTGMSKPVRKYLNASGVDKIIYVSCDPATMTRDLKELLADKYVMEDFRLLDFYPQTSHMEALSLLTRRGS